MKIIVKNSEGRIGSFFALLLMVGIGVGLIHFAGGIPGWIFAFLFFLLALLPLDSFVRPETSILGIKDGILGWCNMKQGKKIDEGSVSVQDISRVVSTKSTSDMLAVVDIQLQMISGYTIDLPAYLHLSVHEKNILLALKNANPSINIEQKNAGPSVACDA